MNQLGEMLVALKEEEVLDTVKAEIEKGTDPFDILDTCQQAMVVIGNKFQKEEYFLPELLVSAELFAEVTKLLTPELKGQKKEPLGSILLGTVKGDLHDIGKNIFKLIAEANGFAVHDLGVDVAPEKFVEKIKEEKPQILGMSGLLTTIFDSMEKTVQLIEEAGLRKDLKIIIGGAPVDEGIQKLVGADSYSRNASEGVELCKKLIGA